MLRRLRLVHSPGGLSVAVASGLLMAMTACSPPGKHPEDGPTESATPASRPAISPETQAPSARAQVGEAVEDGSEGEHRNTELVQNGGFEEWQGGRPVAWQVNEGSGANWRAARPQQAAEACSGTRALDLPEPTGDNFVVAAQGIDSAGIGLDRTLGFGACVKASAPDQVYVLLSFMRSDKRRKMTLKCPATGAWEDLYWLFEVPPDADPSSFRLQILRKPGRPGEVLVDQVSVRFVKIEDAEGW